jgi:PTS system fructose-specific IIC component
MQFGTPQTGFLGAIVGGVLAGVIAHWIAGLKVPSWARGLMPVLIIPLFTSMVAGFLMIVVFGKPIAWLMEKLTERPEQHERRQRHPARRRSSA